MTTAAAIGPTVESPSYCAQITAAVNLVAGHSEGELLVRATSLGGYGREGESYRLDGRAPAFHAVPFLRWLEAGDWEVRMNAAVHAPGNAGPRALSMVFAQRAFTPVFARRADESRDRYHVADADVERVREALARFALAPSLVCDAGGEVWSAWALDAPIVDLVEARAWQRRLAVALGADTDVRPQPHGGPARNADDPDTYLPLAGVVRTLGAADDPREIALPVVEPDRVYSLRDLEHACADDRPAATAARKKGLR